MDIQFGSPTTQAPTMSAYKDLAEDENLKLTYEMRPNPLYSGQITVGVVFSNQSDKQLVSIEFNVLDSLNTKLERPMGSSTHEGVKVPFQLPPGMANECQMTFYVKSFLMPQKLRGTVTYMAKSDEGTASDKLDFSLHLPCSAFICPMPCVNQHFSTLLGSGSLCDTQTVNVSLSNVVDFSAALQTITQGLHLSIVEHIDNSASLYGCSITSQHICLLVKEAGSGKLIVNAKGSDSQLVSNLLDEVKALV
jgi:AP-3 complex subunit delta-1